MNDGEIVLIIYCFRHFSSKNVNLFLASRSSNVRICFAYITENVILLFSDNLLMGLYTF